MNHILKASLHSFKQIKELLSQLDNEQYQAGLEVLSKNSIGMHIRHVIEFYICLMEGIPMGKINYDLRRRDNFLQTNIAYTLATLEKCEEWLSNLEDPNQALQLETMLLAQGDCMELSTTLLRELVYNIEHAIHHLAIVRIAVAHAFTHIYLPQDFGYAYSTLKSQTK